MRDDDVADRQVVAPRPELDHLAAELVAHHDVALRLEQRHGPERIRRLAVASSSAQRRALRAVAEQVQVAAADAAGQDPGQHLSWPGDRVGDLVDPQLPVAHHGGTHRVGPYPGCGRPLDVWTASTMSVERGVGIDRRCSTRQFGAGRSTSAPIVDQRHAPGELAGRLDLDVRASGS